MYTDKQIHEIEQLCIQLEAKSSTITVMPYFSLKKDHVLIHVHHIVFYEFKSGRDGTFYDHWFLRSPQFIPVFSGREEKVARLNEQVVQFSKELEEITASID